MASAGTWTGVESRGQPNALQQENLRPSPLLEHPGHGAFSWSGDTEQNFSKLFNMV